MSDAPEHDNQPSNSDRGGGGGDGGGGGEGRRRRRRGRRRRSRRRGGGGDQQQGQQPQGQQGGEPGPEAKQVEGCLFVTKEGFGFLRQAKNSYLSGSGDPFVPAQLVQR